MPIKSIGFPRMHKEKGERRDFLPELFKNLLCYSDIEIVLEEGYGSAMGFSKEDYLSQNPRIKFVKHEEAYEKDMVIVLRAPEEYELDYMRRGAVLVSMLHYDTRASRNELLKRKGLACFSMDSLTDDKGSRMLVNYYGTSSAGVKVAFNELKKRMKNFYSADRRPINVSIIGMGAVGLNAAKALELLSDREFLDNNGEVPGLLIRMLPRTITKDERILRELFADTDILVDASKRITTSEYIVRNSLISCLPEHAVILDLSADPYNVNVHPMQVKGIEGIPTGTLDKYVIQPNDDAYNYIPDGVESTHRRLVVSCNAWPGVEPEECMAVYGEQILPFIRVLLSKEPDQLDIKSESLYERALVRASLDYFLKKTMSF